MRDNFIRDVLGIILVACVLVMTYMSLNQKEKLGSVTIASEYTATSTWPGAWPTAAEWVTNTPKVLVSGPAVLGSVVITGAGAGNLTFYDATTTNSSLRTKAATTTLVTFPVSVAAGTYTFDINAYTGLIAEFKGTIATTTITYRQR